ncbi:MAG: hypothetical protein C0622_14420 [Desulfuromonas sp.]|nr:MAG: hypothetical protein C0622_14420 [Desulfuromonas sp.]
MLLRVLVLLFLLAAVGLPVRGEETSTAAGDANWLDRSHELLSDRTQQAAIWFDSFFGDQRDTEVPASISTRISLGWKTSHHGVNDNFIRIRAKARLPQLKERFYLILSNEEEDDYNLLPLEASRPESAARSDDEFNAALRWIKENIASGEVDAQLGLRSWSDVYLRGRYHRLFNLSKASELRLTPEVFIDSEYGLGSRLLSEVDYLFDHPGLVRFSLRGQVASETERLDWRSGLSYTYRFSKKSAIVTGFYMNGASDENDVENYSASIRLRQNFWRPYLYYEIEPYLDWPDADGYRTDYGIALSLHMVIAK